LESDLPAMEVTNNTAKSRYELPTPHGLAIAVYRQQGNALVFTHTEVPSDDEGQGIGSRLVRAALDDAKRRGLRIVPACSFVVDFVRRHPQYGDDAG
jgi:predicted GNAT family acetyltransferase